ncbi:MAG TPA: tetratricopeptide repeat protein [Fimbriimonas sp.]
MSSIMDAEALYQRGFQLRCDGRYAEARDDLQRVLALNPNHYKAQHQLGLIQGFEGDFEGSLATLTALSSRFPNDLDIRYDLAMTQLMLGMFDEGCANINFILSVDPTHEKAMQQSAYCP